MTAPIGHVLDKGTLAIVENACSGSSKLASSWMVGKCEERYCSRAVRILVSSTARQSGEEVLTLPRTPEETETELRRRGLDDMLLDDDIVRVTSKSSIARDRASPHPQLPLWRRPRPRLIVACVLLEGPRRQLGDRFCRSRGSVLGPCPVGVSLCAACGGEPHTPSRANAGAGDWHRSSPCRRGRGLSRWAEDRECGRLLLRLGRGLETG